MHPHAAKLVRLICKPNLKCLASFAPEIWPGPQNVEMSHVTLTTPTCGIVRHHWHHTRPTNIRNLKTLALAVPDIFKEVQNSKMCHVIMTTQLEQTDGIA